jgi:hypothetical protein
VTREEIREAWLLRAGPWAGCIRGIGYKPRQPTEAAAMVQDMIVHVMSKGFADFVVKAEAEVLVDAKADAEAIRRVTPAQFYTRLLEHLARLLTTGLRHKGIRLEVDPGELMLATGTVGLEVRPGRQWTFSDH